MKKPTSPTKQQTLFKDEKKNEKWPQNIKEWIGFLVSLAIIGVFIWILISGTIDIIKSGPRGDCFVWSYVGDCID